MSKFDYRHTLNNTIYNYNPSYNVSKTQTYVIFFFIFFFQNKTVQLDFDYFVQLFEQFYLSDDPSDLGNFINGKLDYNDKSESGKDDSDEEDEDPGLEDHKIDSNASLDSMDSDLNVKKKKGSSEDSIWLHAACIKYLRERCDEPFECCCAIS